MFTRANLWISLLLCAALLTACSSKSDQGIGSQPSANNPLGRWTSLNTGIFDVLPAGQDRYTVVFKDATRPKLTLLAVDNRYTASGSISNAAARETVLYALSGTFNTSQINGTLRIVKQRFPGGAVFSTQTIQLRALKQRHDTAAAPNE